MKENSQNRGSMTLEAAIMVPLFVMIMLIANGLFLMFMGQQVMLHSLVQSSKSLAFDPYATQKFAADSEDHIADVAQDLFDGGVRVSTEEWYKSENLGDLDDTVKERFLAYLKQNDTDASKVLDIVGVKDGAEGIDFSGCSINDGVLTIKITYTQEYVFNAWGLASFDRELEIKVRLFEYKNI